MTSRGEAGARLWGEGWGVELRASPAGRAAVPACQVLWARGRGCVGGEAVGGAAAVRERGGRASGWQRGEEVKHTDHCSETDLQGAYVGVLE